MWDTSSKSFAIIIAIFGTGCNLGDSEVKYDCNGETGWMEPRVRGAAVSSVSRWKLGYSRLNVYTN